MGTSNSSSASWRASALLYSGRPNPEWALTDGDAERLVALWSALLPARAAAAPESGLGYRGCVLRDGVRRWQAFDGVAILASAASVETRADANRVFELAILVTAPRGTIPESVLF
jgi:hypothetical protein